MKDEFDSSYGQLQGLPYRPIEARTDQRELLDVLLSECIDRYRNGDTQAIENCLKRHPNLETELRELLPLIGMMESFKHQREAEVFRNVIVPELTSTPIKHYQLTREIGRGGMGIVFEAIDLRSGKGVAFKLLPNRYVKSSRDKHRFREEINTARSLAHPHIVPILDAGEHEGLTYYVMPLIDGIDLDKIIRQLQQNEEVIFASPHGNESRSTSDTTGINTNSSLPTPFRALTRHSFRKFASIAYQVTRVLHSIHARSLIHRDIKSSNILLDCYGKVWVADFGLAQPLVSDLLDAEQTDLAGTYRYMAPEQFQRKIDSRSDLYGLGIVLYELATLDSKDRPSTLFPSHSLEEKPKLPAPRSLNSKIPRDFEAIVVKACEDDPSRRYQTAVELADDLQRFIKGLPIQSRIPTTVRKKSWLSWFSKSSKK